MKSVLIVLALLICAAAAESIRETETMDPNGMFDDIMESSGSLPDDEDLDDHYEDSDSADEGSGSGDEMDDLESTPDTPTTTMGNKIPENDFRGPKNDIDVFQTGNDIMVKKNALPNGAEQSNEISMASTVNSFFSKTEVIVALVAGTVVGLLFAIFIIVLLVMRIRRNKGDLTYDTVKKPIYKKAPTVEA
ncbi:PREDICTED: syndecan 4-B-like [Nanorana parkeri]|uniref:syndecan 4-B-like n=1 Tax=Nanorana parkeri TaxID=125878 RepID=UPI000854C9C8|nr:PREDICTED: syndecan 4-B-like [Nanorana parkeri]